MNKILSIPALILISSTAIASTPVGTKYRCIAGLYENNGTLVEKSGWVSGEVMPFKIDPAQKPGKMFEFPFKKGLLAAVCLYEGDASQSSFGWALEPGQRANWVQLDVYEGDVNRGLNVSIQPELLSKFPIATGTKAMWKYEGNLTDAKIPSVLVACEKL